MPNVSYPSIYSSSTPVVDRRTTHLLVDTIKGECVWDLFDSERSSSLLRFTDAQVPAVVDVAAQWPRHPTLESFYLSLFFASQFDSRHHFSFFFTLESVDAFSDRVFRLELPIMRSRYYSLYGHISLAITKSILKWNLLFVDGGKNIIQRAKRKH